MAVTYGFYNSSNGDRKYNALQFSRLFEGIIRDGVFSTVGGSLMVVAASNLTVNISPGRAWFNNTWTNNDALLPLTLDPAEAILNRYDAVVLEVAPDERENRFKIVKGTPATTPAKPTMIKTGGIYQYPLAYIYVGKGVGSISQANISNAVGTTECPFITGALQQVTTNDIIAQWESEFNTWFDNLQAQLEGNVVTNLQNQINTKLTADGGDGKDVVVSFTEAATEAHIASGEKLSVLFGKILKMFKGKAPNSHASSATTYGVGTTANFGHCKTINNLTQASHVDGNALSAYQGKVLDSQNISSYLAFCANINGDSLDSAFGKGNESIVSGIGRQLYMYSKFKNPATPNMPNIITKNSFADVLESSSSRNELLSQLSLISLISASPYATGVSKTYFPVAGDDNNVVIAGINTMGAVSQGEPIATVTVPYTGSYRVKCTVIDNYSINITFSLYVNDTLVLSKEIKTGASTGRSYTFNLNEVISVKQGDLVKVTHNSTKTTYANGVYLITDRPELPPSSTDGTIPIWIFNSNHFTSDGVLTAPFVCKKAGTYRVSYRVEGYSKSNAELRKNGVSVKTGATGNNYSISLAVGDSLTLFIKGSGWDNLGAGFGTVCAADNPYIYPY